MSDGTTITLADGTVIDVLTGKPVETRRVVEVPSADEAVREVVRVRRRVHELPDVPERLNGIAVVAVYHMFGLDPTDIAYATNLTEHQVNNIMMLDAFTTLLDELTKAQVAAIDQDTRASISELAPMAVGALKDALHDEDMKVRVVAAKDVLDRSGHRPSDVVEHRHKVDADLRIEYVKRDDNAVPAIEVDYSEIKDGTSG